MCKIVKYWFACHHRFRLRRSKCGGTRHKQTRAGTAPACKSEPYLCLALPVDCGPCQHQAFEDGWKQILSIAELFLEGLVEKRHAAVREVTTLVEQLNNNFNTAAWDTRLRFPHTHKERTVRVSLGSFEKSPSPLRNEVAPDDVHEFVHHIGPEDPDHEFNADYVASTDPIHPVDTNYDHPLDGVDPSWLLNHLSVEELEQDGGELGFDAGEVNVAWTACAEGAAMTSSDRGKVTSEWKPEVTEPDLTNRDSNKTSDQPLGTAPVSSQLQNYTGDKHLLADCVDTVIHEFWNLVNGTSPNKLSAIDISSSLTYDVDHVFKCLHISDPLSRVNTIQTGLLTPPQTPPKLSVHRPNDLKAPSPTSTSRSHGFAGAPSSLLPTNAKNKMVSTTSQHTSPQATNSARRFQGNWRRYIAPATDVDTFAINRELLFLSRCEIKDREGANGRFVLDPQFPRDGDAKNGWFK